MLMTRSDFPTASVYLIFYYKKSLKIESNLRTRWLDGLIGFENFVMLCRKRLFVYAERDEAKRGTNVYGIRERNNECGNSIVIWAPAWPHPLRIHRRHLPLEILFLPEGGEHKNHSCCLKTVAFCLGIGVENFLFCLKKIILWIIQNIILMGNKIRNNIRLYFFVTGSKFTNKQKIQRGVVRKEHWLHCFGYNFFGKKSNVGKKSV